MIRGLIFDKDGTLFDFRRSWADWAVRLFAWLTPDPGLRAALADRVGFLPQDLDFRPDSPVIAGTSLEVAELMHPLLPALPLPELLDRINHFAATARMVEATPLRPLLLDLRARGLALGLATNDAEAPAEAHLERHDIRDLFDFVAGYDSGYGGKPAPGQLLEFAARTGIAAGQIAMVGDSLHDLDAAASAGMMRIAVLTGIAGREVLAPSADLVLPDIGALPAWLDSQSL